MVEVIASKTLSKFAAVFELQHFEIRVSIRYYKDKN